MFIQLLQKYLLRVQSALLGIVLLALLVGNPSVSAQQGSTTLEVRVTAGSDDAEENVTGNVSIESEYLELVLGRSNQTVGMRFNGIDIPPQARITSAYIQFRAAKANAETTSLRIQGEASDNALTFATTDENISSRPKTITSVVWTPVPWLMEGATGPIQKTPNIASIIQEITLRPGWARGNSLVILMTGSGKRIAEAYDHIAYAAPLLHVEYMLDGNISPVAEIVSPLNGSTYNQGDLVTLTGKANDFEDDDLTGSLTWTSSLDGTIGMGSTVSTSNLSVGVHTIQAIATDSAGSTGSATITVTVFEETPVLVGAGDIAYEGQRDEETAKLLETIPGRIFTLGDNVYTRGRFEEFNTYFEPTWGRHKSRTSPSIGDHEYKVPGAYGYFRYFGPAAGNEAQGYYSYDLGDWHIIVLNSECARIGGCGPQTRQGQWLQADLAANPKVCTLAYFHNPLFTSSTSSAVPETKDLWKMLYNAEVDVILNGRAHNYERFSSQNPDGQADPTRGIREFVVGTGGTSLNSFDTTAPNSEVRNSKTAGVLKLTLKPTSYDWEFIPIAGEIFTDTGSADCVTSSITPNLPTVTATSSEMDTPTAVARTATALPTEINVLNVTASVMPVSTDTASEEAFQTRLPVLLAMLIPLLVYFLFLYFRRSQQ